MSLLLGALALAIWVGLIGFHDDWWRVDAEVVPSPLNVWPSVVAVVPARDEADVVGRTIAALAAQDYPGEFRIILVDDDSSDGTAAVARAAAQGSDRLTILSGAPLPQGWTGKLWALSQGIEAAGSPGYLWLTDADIDHAPETLRNLAAIAVPGRLALVSLMARLRCEAFAERLLIPAFVYFFQMLFPFRAVNRPGATAAAAGGCMFVEARALAAAGGIASVRGAIIDDCAMGALLKRQGPIRLSLTGGSLSLRANPRIGDVGAMIARSAYAQLDYSPWRLAGTLLGLGLVFIVPPLLSLAGHGIARLTGIAAWSLIALSFQPMLRFYRRSPLWGLALPLIAAIYCWYTIVSAVQVWRGHGGQWKGRTQAMASL